MAETVDIGLRQLRGIKVIGIWLKINLSILGKHKSLMYDLL